MNPNSYLGKLNKSKKFRKLVQEERRRLDAVIPTKKTTRRVAKKVFPRTLIYLDERREVEAYLSRVNSVWCIDVARWGSNIENMMIDPKAEGDELWLLVEHMVKRRLRYVGFRGHNLIRPTFTLTPKAIQATQKD